MLRQKLVQDQIAALKNHDQEQLSTLRYILAKIKYKEIEKKPLDSARGKSDLTDEEVILILRKIAKELNESITAATTGKRQNLVSEYQKQLAILSAYLPKELTDEELKKEVEKIIDENKELYEKNKKALIGICVGRLKSKADPSRIIKILQTI